MITAIPCLKIMKSVTDSNVTGDNADERRMAFTACNELITLADFELLIEGKIYEMIEHRLDDAHKVFFNSIYKIDNSAKGVSQYDIYGSLKWVAKSESKSRRVILITQNLSEFDSISNNRIIVVSPSNFLKMKEKAILLYKTKFFSCLEDALIAVFFSKELTSNLQP